MLILMMSNVSEYMKNEYCIEYCIWIIYRPKRNVILYFPLPKYK